MADAAIMLEFEIPPGLYRRAVTHPMVEDKRPNRRIAALRNGAAAILGLLSAAAMAMALFDYRAILPAALGAVLGAGIVLAAWWRRHLVLVARSQDFNATSGRHRMEIGPGGIFTAKPDIETRLGWPIVKAIRGMEGATLIDLPNARLIVPDAALPENMPVEAFRTRLEIWKSAS